MIEVAYTREENLIEEMSTEVKDIIRGILEILDNEYGADRDKYEDNGGYVVVIEREEDFKDILEKTHIKCNDVIPEYVDRIDCSDGRVYTNSLILCNS